MPRYLGTAIFIIMGFCLSGQVPVLNAANLSSKYLLWHLTPAEGSTPELASRVESLLRRYIERRARRLVMDGVTMDSLILVEGNEKFLRCGVGPVCLAGLGKSAGTKWVIAGEVHVRAGRVMVELVLVDTSKKQVVARASTESTGTPNRKHLNELYVGMFHPERYKGSVDLTCGVAGAEVLIDGKKKGLTPLGGPLTDLPAGKHMLEVKKQGHQAFSRQVHIPIGQIIRVVVLLPESQSTLKRKRAFYQSWTFWTLGSVGLVSTGLAAGLLVDAGTLQDNADLARKSFSSDWRQWQDKADSRSTQSYIAFGLGGSLLIAASVVAFIDVLGSGEPSPTRFRVSHLCMVPWRSAYGLSVILGF